MTTELKLEFDIAIGGEDLLRQTIRANILSEVNDEILREIGARDINLTYLKQLARDKILTPKQYSLAAQKVIVEYSKYLCTLLGAKYLRCVKPK